MRVTTNIHYLQHNTSIKLVAGKQTDRQIDQPTDRLTDRPTDIANYRSAIAAKKLLGRLQKS